MTQAIPVMLPIAVNTAENAVSAQSGHKNQRVGEQGAFTDLLVTQFRQRGLAATDLLRAVAGEMVGPGQEVPHGGNRLPVSTAENGRLLEMLSAFGDTDPSGLTTMSSPEEGGGLVLDNLLRGLMNRGTGAGVTLPDTGDLSGEEAGRLAALVLRAFDEHSGPLNRVGQMSGIDAGESGDIADEFLSRNHIGRGRANELPFTGYLPVDLQSRPAASPAFPDRLPELLTQQLTGNTGGSAPASALPGAQQAGQLFSQLAGAGAMAGGSQMPTTAVSVPMGHADWGHELGERVRWLVNQSVQSAEIRLNPPELGPVRVHISVDQAQQVSVAFTSQHATVRDALETAMSQLRDTLAQNGLSLANGSVADQSAGERRQAENGTDESIHVTADGEQAAATDDDQSGDPGVRTGRLGLIDQFV